MIKNIDPASVFSIDVKRLMGNQYKDIACEHSRRPVQNSNPIHRKLDDKKRSHNQIPVKW